MHVVIHSRIEYEQTEWAVGLCPHCGQMEILRVERVNDVVCLGGFPVSSTPIGIALRCDFCLRLIDSDPNRTRIPLRAWHHPEGMAELIRKLGLPAAIEVPDPNSPARIHSLLSSVRDSCWLGNMEITLGLVTGAVAGVAAGVFIAIGLFEGGMVRPAIGRLGAAILGGVVGGLSGVILGPFVEAVVRRGRLAAHRVKVAHGNHKLDIDKLTEISLDYPSIIRRAVRSLRDEEERSRSSR
jgi:hypothetical protein